MAENSTDLRRSFICKQCKTSTEAKSSFPTSSPNTTPSSPPLSLCLPSSRSSGADTELSPVFNISKKRKLAFVIVDSDSESEHKANSNNNVISTEPMTVTEINTDQRWKDRKFKENNRISCEMNRMNTKDTKLEGDVSSSDKELQNKIGRIWEEKEDEEEEADELEEGSCSEYSDSDYNTEDKFILLDEKYEYMNEEGQNNDRTRCRH